MESEKKFGLLRQILRTIGLSRDAADDVVNWIVDTLAGESEKDESGPSPEFPYHLRPHFLSAAESKFYDALRTCVGNHTTIQCKVGLRDLFEVKAEDQSRYRIYTNKIDRKHVDFVCCDPVTMRPLYAIELDDRSHQRADRQARDIFVDGVFKAGRLPLIHIPVKASYNQAELKGQLATVLGVPPSPQPVPPAPSIVTQDTEPICPKCGGKMVLRTAKSGANAGNQFWGCAGYPQCKTMLPYKSVRA
jgi:Protein of unknown function (DUF2726)/Topoisomerase DNA binding C4 zinc finger